MGVRFVITTPSYGAIGMISFGMNRENPVKPHVATLGYFLGKPFWGKGYMTESLRALIPYAFNEKGVHRLEASTFANNIGSCKVLKKAGFRLECTKRDALLERLRPRDAGPPKFQDEACYMLLKTDVLIGPSGYLRVVNDNYR